MQRRIMGMEMELGAIRKLPDGSWAPLSAYHTALRSLLSKIGASERRPLFLANGGCIYPDCGHLEYATPECLSPRDVVAAVRGGERWVEERFSAPLDSDAGQILFIKDNTDATDEVTFGCHENYLIDTVELPFNFGTIGFTPRHSAALLAFLATRILLTGAGVVSARKWKSDCPLGSFLLSHRARCVNVPYAYGGHGAQRPFISMKGQPLAYVPGRFFQRLELMCGDPNMSELADFLKFGTTHLLLRLLEEMRLDGLDLPLLSLRNLIKVHHGINADPDCRALFFVDDSDRRMSALDIQEAYLETIARVFPRDDDPDDVRAECNEILSRWADVLSKLRRDPRSAVRDLDWVHKMVLEERWLNGHGVDSFKHLERLFRENRERAQTFLEQLKGLEQRYHELSPRGLWRMQEKAGRVTRITTDDEISQAKDYPPGHTNPSHRTRSWIRGMYIRWAQEHGVRYKVSDWMLLILYLAGTPFSTFAQRSKSRFFLHLPDPFRWNIQEPDTFFRVD